MKSNKVGPYKDPQLQAKGTVCIIPLPIIIRGWVCHTQI